MAKNELYAGHILRINNEKLLLLIELYKQHECLWNTALEDYPHKYRRRRAAADIADKLGIEGFTAHHVMVKFKNMRSSYCQEMKKIAQNEALVARGIEKQVYKPSVCWFSAMDSFIKPHVRKRTESSRKKSKRKEMTSDQEDMGGPMECDTQAHIDLTPNKITKEIMIDSSENEASNDSQIKTKKEDSSKREHCCNPKLEVLIVQEDIDIKEEQIEQDELVEHEELEEKDEQVDQDELVEQYEQVKQHEQVEQDGQVQSSSTDYLIENESDFHGCFGKYVASLLSKMPPQKALELQPKILSLIFSHFEEN